MAARQVSPRKSQLIGERVGQSGHLDPLEMRQQCVQHVHAQGSRALCEMAGLLQSLALADVAQESSTARSGADTGRSDRPQPGKGARPAAAGSVLSNRRVAW